jgi:plastocyanin
MSKLRWTALSSILILVPLGARASEESELKELRKEVRELRVLLEAMIRSDKQRSEILEQALRTVGRGVEPAPAPGSVPLPAPPLSLSAATSEPAPPPTPPSSAKNVAVRGKVLVTGEPGPAWVYVENIAAPPVKNRRLRDGIAQRGLQFVPSAAVVQLGTTIEFPNYDARAHNVYSPKKPVGDDFDLQYYQDTDPKHNHPFLRTGVFKIFCNIHKDMEATVLVVPNSYYAQVKDDGSFVIPNVPIGKRKIVAWTPDADPVSQTIELGADTPPLSFEIKHGPKQFVPHSKEGGPNGYNEGAR